MSRLCRRAQLLPLPRADQAPDLLAAELRSIRGVQLLRKADRRALRPLQVDLLVSGGAHIQMMWR